MEPHELVSLLFLLGFIGFVALRLPMKPRPVSEEQYVYSKPSDDDFFDAITEYRNDIPGK